MKTYIFSNCKKNDLKTYEKNLLEKIPLDSRLVILNKGEVYYQIKAFNKYKNQIMILRTCGSHGLRGYFGLQNIVGTDRVKIVSDIICFDPRGSLSALQIGHRDGTVDEKLIKTPWNNEYEAATKGKAVTTGYAAYYLVQDLYDVKPEDIYLVNFYGNNDASTDKWNGHAWDFEDKWLQDKQRIYC